MSGMQTFATLTRGDAVVAGRRAAEMGTGDPRAAAPGGIVDRCRRCEELLARWTALVDRPGEDLDPDSPTGREALALMEALEAEVRWLEDTPARTAGEARAKLAVGAALVRASGSAEVAPHFHAFLLAARAEVAEAAGRRRGAPIRDWLFGFSR